MFLMAVPQVGGRRGRRGCSCRRRRKARGVQSSQMSQSRRIGASAHRRGRRRPCPVNKETLPRDGCRWRRGLGCRVGPSTSHVARHVKTMHDVTIRTTEPRRIIRFLVFENVNGSMRARAHTRVRYRVLLRALGLSRPSAASQPASLLLALPAARDDETRREVKWEAGAHVRCCICETRTQSLEPRAQLFETRQARHTLLFVFVDVVVGRAEAIREVIAVGMVIRKDPIASYPIRFPIAIPIPITITVRRSKHGCTRGPE